MYLLFVTLISITLHSYAQSDTIPMVFPDFYSDIILPTSLELIPISSSNIGFTVDYSSRFKNNIVSRNVFNEKEGKDILIIKSREFCLETLEKNMLPEDTIAFIHIGDYNVRLHRGNSKMNLSSVKWLEITKHPVKSKRKAKKHIKFISNFDSLIFYDGCFQNSQLFPRLLDSLPTTLKILNLSELSKKNTELCFNYILQKQNLEVAMVHFNYFEKWTNKNILSSTKDISNETIRHFETDHPLTKELVFYIKKMKNLKSLRLSITGDDFNLLTELSHINHILINVWNEEHKAKLKSIISKENLLNVGIYP